MKFNKWTLGLAAVGVVSLASAARADEKLNPLETALSNTTISGYVSASFNWQVTPGGNVNSPARMIPFQGQNNYGSYYYDYYDYNYNTKQDGFNLDVVKLSISKPQDESPWASGYQIDLLFGPDAVNYNTSVNAFGGGTREYGNYYGTYPDFAIKQAYVALRTPVGNGIDWKIGVFDTIIGYEVFDAGSNPNYTRSWGYAVEPTEHTGVLATYKINDQWSVSAGVANTLMSGINARAYQYGGYQLDAWHKTFMGSLTYVAPSSWGWAAGSSFYLGAVYGFGGASGYYSYEYSANGYGDGDQCNVYAGATVNTPWKQLTVGAAFDYVHNRGGGYSYSSEGDSYQYWEDTAVIGLYGTFKATDKLSFNARGEWAYNRSYYHGNGIDYADNYTSTDNALELTGTVEYDLWANVISRVEIRYDHDMSGGTGDGYQASSLGLYANVIYKF
jgi:hypothetical protein